MNIRLLFLLLAVFSLINSAFSGTKYATLDNYGAARYLSSPDTWDGRSITVKVLDIQPAGDSSYKTGYKSFSIRTPQGGISAAVPNEQCDSFTHTYSNNFIVQGGGEGNYANQGKFLSATFVKKLGGGFLVVGN